MATNNNGNRERDLFEAPLEIASVEGRLAYLQGACGEDAALLARVQAPLQPARRILQSRRSARIGSAIMRNGLIRSHLQRCQAVVYPEILWSKGKNMRFPDTSSRENSHTQVEAPLPPPMKPTDDREEILFREALQRAKRPGVRPGRRTNSNQAIKAYEN